jgi:hypothetical protein
VVATRLLAIGTLALIGFYYVFRFVVAACVGGACDNYIPLSLLIPVLILVLTAITGVLATRRARGRTAWFPALLVSTLVGVLGPILALIVFRDRPDAFVATATVFELVVPIVALGFSFADVNR